jgi:hypothetical protein
MGEVKFPLQLNLTSSHHALENKGAFRHHDGGRAKSAAIPRRFASDIQAASVAGPDAAFHP